MSGLEKKRLKEDKVRAKNWKRWGPYLSERQWGTVREDYSDNGDCWSHFTHDQSRSRAYRWGEDGLLGITDRQCRLCLSLALWNTRDPILKERLYGLTGHQGNHGEDVKELYYYLDNTPTHSYMKALYKYPQAEFPYAELEAENARRGVKDPEYELMDTGVFNENRYFDVTAEYCKNSPNDILGRYTVVNRGPERATVHVLPQLWYRNVWDWGDDCEAYVETKPILQKDKSGRIRCEHPSLGKVQERYRLNSMDTYVMDLDCTHNRDLHDGRGSSAKQGLNVHDESVFYFEFGPDADGKQVPVIFTENSTNYERLYCVKNRARYVKDAFHDYVVQDKKNAVNLKYGTKCAGQYILDLDPGQGAVIKVRLYTSSEAPPGEAFTGEFEDIFRIRINEADMFYDEVIPTRKKQEQRIARQAYAGLLWSKQFYYYILKEWLRGDSNQPPPPPSRALWGRNKDWTHLFNRDVVSMPDKWEYPWYASWDLAFHMIAMSRVDIQFAKAQLVLLLREWYMHPNGQIPAYEFAFDDVNPPVHAYAVLRIYKFSGLKGTRDEQFLARCFHKLVLNFTWWVNRKDIEGKNIFSGGFLGLDNIGVFDRSKPLPAGGFLAQADASAWMGFFCSIMLEMSLLLAHREPIYQDMASKFFEHFVSIVDAMNNVDGIGLWDEADGFFYDHVRNNHLSQPVKIKSMVGLIPLCCALVLEDKDFRHHPGFAKRTKWFIENRKDLSKGISLMTRGTHKEGSLLLSIVSKEKMIRILGHMLDEKKFLSPYGIRSLSKEHQKEPFTLHLGGSSYSVKYEPGESESKLFGGNSNWRGPIWLPMNYLIIENLRRYDYYFGEGLMVECPTGSGVLMRLGEVAQVLERRLINLFLPDANGKRPCHGKDEIYATDPHFKHLCLFYEYFHGDTGRGCGASHQTGWTALIANILEKSADVEEGYDSADDLEFFD
ncbi:uncharacterized protein LOC127838481 [Dreissena polymorpha]|uniref:Mannosylglycerate hydrolase MGH1-like glycoside hydrolase domain-containing protein n=1 Tax=Dreissena polymorpha TaxID=45954 RepID=A0A9D4N039_DREPO|nr:uncharacterized protein LOC127838481 [Dreissena polymorpha]KAH3884844.1 hypothetical protein DPMN_008829 [Dreissena polymorpha]